MLPEPTVSVIIVNWNGKKWLPECFKSLAGQTYKSTEIIFVDNDSGDDSVSWVRRHYPRTKIIRNTSNTGFSHANNIGYRSATGKYVLFLNNDTRSDRGMISELVRVLESDQTVACVQAKILLMDDNSRLDSIGAYLTNTGFLYHYCFRRKDDPVFDKPTELYTAKGACMMFRSDVLKKTEVEGNIFDPDYFAYFEETDLCHRVWLAGYRIIYAPESVVYHKMGATSSLMDNSFIQFHSFKNRITSYIKNLDLLHLITILPIHLFLCLVLVAVSVIRGKLRLSLAIIMSLIWVLRHAGSVLRKRRFIQRYIRKVSDRVFFGRIVRNPRLVYYVLLVQSKTEMYESSA